MQLCGSSGDGSGTIVGQIDLPPGGLLLGTAVAGAVGPAGAPGAAGPQGLKGDAGPAVDIHGSASKNPPVLADEFIVADSGDKWALKKVTLADLKAALAIDGGTP